MGIKSSRGWCAQCESNEKSKSRRQHLAGLKGLTVKERIEKIESCLYDLKKIISEMKPIVDSHIPFA